MKSSFTAKVKPDWESFLACIRREGTPKRVHYAELFLDQEVQTAICRRFGLLEGLDRGDPHYGRHRYIRVQRFLGYDYVRVGCKGLGLPKARLVVEDSAALKRARGRSFVNEHKGPITTWEEFESYPWPKAEELNTEELEWYQKNLPDDMCIIGSMVCQYAEQLSWLMGYETLCYALFDRRELPAALSGRLGELYDRAVDLMLEFDRVQAIWGSDDMGFRSGPLISPADLREFVLPGHRRAAQKAHAAGRPYLLHSCGNLAVIMEDLISDVKIDAKHSFEDTIESVIETKAAYGERLSFLGGIDMDFLCRATEEQVRKRVRETLEHCLAGGGYCLGTGNSVANYIPLNNYLAMLDEGRRFAA